MVKNKTQREMNQRKLLSKTPVAHNKSEAKQHYKMLVCDWLHSV
jgi:hypothetical protein